MSSSERVQKDTTLQPQEEDRTNIDFVPDTGLIFIDTSAINWVYPGDYRGKSVGKYRALTTTHSNQILQLLQENPNIRTTREVVKEVYDTLVEIRRRIKASGEHCFQKEGTIKKLRLKRAIYEIIRKERVDVNYTQDSKLEHEVQTLLPVVNRIFLREKGTLKQPYTDTRLIAHALMHAKQDATGIFSCDLPLLRAWACCTREIGLTLQRTFVCDGFCRITSPTQEYRKQQSYGHGPVVK